MRVSWFALAAPVALLLAGCSGLSDEGVAIEVADPRCPAPAYQHYHPAFALYLDGERVRFTNRSFYSFSVQEAVHIHADDGILHIEPFDDRCIPFEAALRKLGVTASDVALTLSPQHGDLAGRYATSEYEPLRAYHKTFAGKWETLTVGQLTSRVVHPGEKVLLTYGALDEATLAAQQASVPEPQPPLPGTTAPG